VLAAVLGGVRDHGVVNVVWSAALGIAGCLLLLWLGLVLALVVVGRRRGTTAGVTEAMRLLPDVVRVIRRLATDQTLPRRVRWQLWALVAYLVLPIDLVPDFIPVAGQADDLLLVAIVLRSTVRAVGPQVLERHWPGTPTGLAVVRRLAGVPA
jgi:uncharacterized membrane protein YkvA (DUF1232 family)